MSADSHDPDLRRAAARPAVWVVLTLLAYSLLLVIFSGELTLLSALDTVASWLRAVPGPDEHWATILSAAAWPVALLLIAYRLRDPIQQAADRLAKRFDKDNVKIPGLLEVTNANLTTLGQDAATMAAGTAEAVDAKHISALLEFADEPGNADRLKAWISAELGPTSDREAFISDRRFANAREKAYNELLIGKANA